MNSQSVTRRAALKKFGVGLAGMALACFGLADKAGAARRSLAYCQVTNTGSFGLKAYTGMCMDIERCVSVASTDCLAQGTIEVLAGNRMACGSQLYDSGKRCSFAI